jgi:RNA polymerase sigma-70 factor (ECF subfamily)
MRRRRIVRFVPWTGESHGAAPSAEHLAMEMRLSGPLSRALARIPERQRAALLLAEVHDLTGLELADTLGVSHVAARALLTRARESLRQTLADEKRQEEEHEATIDATFAKQTRLADSRRSADDDNTRAQR